MPKLNEFVSSTIEELREERARIKMALEPLGLDVFLFELDAGARSESTRHVYTDEVLQCDIYIGLFKHLFSKPTKEEYELASANNKEILIYIFDTSEENRDKDLSHLLTKLSQKHTRKKYISVQEIEKEVRQNVLDLLKRRFKQATKQIISTGDWLKLLEYKADLYTSSFNFGKSDKDCWKLGHFGMPEIASHYDARRELLMILLTH